MKRFYCMMVFALAPMTTAVSAQELDTRHYIYIEATGSVSLPAEYASISATATSKGATPDVAIDANNRTMDTLMAALQGAGIARADVSTRSFGFETVYIMPPTANPYERPNPDRDTFDGYRAINAFGVRVSDLEKIGEVLAIIASNGVEIDALKFGSSKAAAAQETTRELAVKNAYARAALMAKASNVQLGLLLQMREGRGYNPETMEDYPVAGEADLAVLPLSGIVPADIVVSNAVSAKWEVLPLE
jgi:uncharacterized protein YggE